MKTDNYYVVREGNLLNFFSNEGDAFKYKKWVEYKDLIYEQSLNRKWFNKNQKNMGRCLVRKLMKRNLDNTKTLREFNETKVFRKNVRKPDFVETKV